MQFIDALESNGTGLLEGMCRPHDREKNFLDIEDTMDSTLPQLDFSFGAQFLGTYPIRVTGTNYVPFNEKGITAEIAVEGSERVIYLMIDYSFDDEFGKFYAQLLQS